MNDKISVRRADDVMASYSCKGPTLLDHVVKPDLVAPGNAIISDLASGSTLATQYPANLIDRSYYISGATGTSGYYLKLSGTSMAAAVASGAAAVSGGRQPSRTP